MDILSILAKDHDKWTNLASNLGVPRCYAEDVVQDVYIKLATQKNPTKIMYNETEVNYWYVCLAIRSVSYDFLKAEGRRTTYEPEEQEADILDSDEQRAFERLYAKIMEEASGFGSYGLRLVQLYFKTDFSIRGLAEESGISVTSIYNSIKQYRQMLRDSLGEDYTDFKNGDYDKI